MPSHSHTSNAIGGTIGLITSNGANTAGGGLDSTAGEPNLYTSPAALTIDNNGSGSAHNNIQPTVFIGNVFIYCGIE
jgi:microcystin-dependent protein